MNPILSAGVLIGVLCGVWMFVMGLTGWYHDPSPSRIFFLVILFEVAGLWWGLRRTAALGRNYGGQVIAGTMIATIAGLIVVVSSLVFTTVAFPDYLTAVQDTTRATLRQQGKSDAEIAEAIRQNAASATPMAQAMSGFLGTLITGIVASAVIGAFVRAQPAKRPA
jgi:hypothetical protein